MKTSSDGLFRLIKSMTKGEKSYFKKSTSSNGVGNSSSNYSKLFDAIAKSSEYDEEALLKKFRKEAFVKNFVETKQYLKTQILRVLRNYNRNKSIVLKLREDISDIEILIQKGLFDLARTQIKKTLKVANKHELVHYIFELNKLHFKLSTILGDAKAIEIHATETIEEEITWLKKVEHSQYYWYHYVRMMHSWKKYGPIQPKPEDQSVSFEDHPLDSFNAAHWYLMKELCIGQVFSNAETYYKDALAYYQLFEKYPDQIDLNPLNYIVSIQLYANACSQASHVEEGLKIVKEGISILEKMVKKNKIAINIFNIYHIDLNLSLLRIYLQNGTKSSFKEQHLILKKLILERLKTENIFKEETILGTIFISDVLLEDWEAAEASYQIITNRKMRGYRNDIEVVMRLLGIIVYYETKNIELLESAVDATYQFVRTKDFLFKFTRQFINLFKHKIINALNAQEQIEHFIQFRTETLAFFEESPKEQKVLSYFDFIAWLNSKIEDIPIHEAYQKRL